ncbi:RBBP9/YdeN family alpha/beta hydrolase [Neobacillus dielmonensis]|uniref:RBBP9/YdeN family alpha/beta hydrolase n=1 Tax=Neobacillus dielmonensis TaxID=1347369 RepID=UPI0005A83D78|nr:alpha/beta fold hydrolase [Neobacillus dielmonensis]
MNKQSFLILHGLGGSGIDHWQSWLAQELGKRGYDVFYPTFSDYSSPEKQVWLEELDTVMNTIPKDQPLTVITHSLGCILWLHYTSSKNRKLANRVILVAPPSPNIVLNAAKTFYPVPLSSGNLTRSAEEILFVHSTNDPYCSMEDAKSFKKLGLSSINFPHSGHINTESGHGKWPWILQRCLAEESQDAII